MKELETILEDLADRLPGLYSSAVVSIQDGLTVAEVNRRLEVGVGVASAYLASIVQSNIKAVKVLGWNEPVDDILITTGKNYFLIRHIPNQDYFHFVMTAKNAWLGQTRLLMKEAGQKILTVLTKNE